MEQIFAHRDAMAERAAAEAAEAAAEAAAAPPAGKRARRGGKAGEEKTGGTAGAAPDSSAGALTITATLMEVYNEDIKDLLGAKSGAGAVKHEVRHNPDGSTAVTGLAEVEVRSAEVGRCKLDPSLKATCFQTLNLRVHTVLST